jgi:NADH-quinone oxidoreductase subunit L
MGGLARKMPQTAIVFIVGTLSLAGVPLFAGFVSKEEVLGGVWMGGFAVPFFMLLGAAFLTAFYMFRVVFLVFFGGPAPTGAARHLQGGDHGDHGVHGAAHAHDAPAVMMLPLWLLALIAIAIGVYFTARPPDAEFHAPGWLTPAAIGVALSGIVLAWLTYQRRLVSADMLAGVFAPIRRAALAKFWLDDLYSALYRRVLLAFSRLVGWVDRYLVDGVLNVVSALTLDAGNGLRRIQTGKIQDYVFAVGFGLLALMVWIGVGW